MIRIGHKGADALVPGNTVASFIRAVEIGVDRIEFDVLWLPDGNPALPAGERSGLVVAHDWEAAAAGPVPSLDEVLEAFTRPPLDRVEINLDIKLQGREDEIVSLVRAHDLVDRTSFSTMEIPTIERIGALEPDLRRGWTVPRVTRDWTSGWWKKPVVLAGGAALRRRLPRIVRAGIPRLGISTVWAFHGVVTPALVEAVQGAGSGLNVWTVDDPGEVTRFRTMGVDGICSNDPRLLQPGGSPS